MTEKNAEAHCEASTLYIGVAAHLESECEVCHYIESGSRNVGEPVATLATDVCSIVVCHDCIMASEDIVEVKTYLYVLYAYGFLYIALVGKMQVRL